MVVIVPVVVKGLKLSVPAMVMVVVKLMIAFSIPVPALVRIVVNSYQVLSLVLDLVKEKKVVYLGGT